MPPKRPVSDDAGRPKVGVAVLVVRDGRVLLGRRLNDDGTCGMYATPGGHVEHLESIVDCCKREMAEEVGPAVKAKDFTVIGVTSVRQFAPRHIILITVRADWVAGEPENLEPEKCGGWDWYPLDALPSPLTPGTVGAIESLKTGKTLFE